MVENNKPRCQVLGEAKVSWCLFGCFLNLKLKISRRFSCQLVQNAAIVSWKLSSFPITLFHAIIKIRWGMGKITKYHALNFQRSLTFTKMDVYIYPFIKKISSALIQIFVQVSNFKGKVTGITSQIQHITYHKLYK